MKRRLTLFIGPTEQSAARLRGIFKQSAKKLGKHGIDAPDWNHVRLYAACAEPDAVGVLRFKRGLDSPIVGRMLHREFRRKIKEHLKDSSAKHFVLAAAQLGNLLHDRAEVTRLRDLLAPHFEDIRIIAHVGDQAQLLQTHYTYALTEGRSTSLASEMALTGGASWWDAALAQRGPQEPHFGVFNDIQSPPFWLDYARLVGLWGDVFGAQKITLRPLDLEDLCAERGTDEVVTCLGLPKPLGSVAPQRIAAQPCGAMLARMRQFNEVLIAYQRVHDISCPRALWSQMLGALRIAGDPVTPDALAQVPGYFASDNAALIKRFPDLANVLRVAPAKDAPPWEEADPELGFRATQYLAAFAHGIRKHSAPLAQMREAQTAARSSAQKFEDLLGDTDPKLLDRVKVNHQMILSSQFRPHNDMGTVDETRQDAPYSAVPPRSLPKGSTGNVIVGCMKNEAPYIVEWIAYHRAIGIDHFLIYTNGCDDGTSELLDRLQAMGIVQHRSNENWKGNSPQQHALNNAIKEPVMLNADWIIHIDVDEYMNVRTGNGTVQDLIAAVPDATNIAMTWRLFGHNGVTALSDDLVIDQFDACAPKYCPKPHTVWGYKTMTRNIGAYAKISCHRPNKLHERFESRVKWVNGSGQDMTRDAINNGWRSSKSNVGYDLLQLNHYALRSADSFLIKRQRGRALHVDRSIGINYWIRMDWNDTRDVTIKRNLPRARAEYDRLMQDDALRALHDAGFKWHQAKAAELHGKDEFSDLYAQALSITLNDTERVAYALSLDMES